MTTCQYPAARTLAAIALAAAMLTGCSPPESPGNKAASQAPAVQGDDGLIAGEALFDQNCGQCHGAGGRGPSLQTLKALSPEDLRAGIINHPTAGQIPNRLPAAEISDLIEFLEE